MSLWIEALAVNIVLAAVSVITRAVRPGAIWGGVLVGTLIYRGAGRPGFAELVLFFVLGVLLTRLGFARKAARGLAEPDEGRRGSAHALANVGVAALCALGMLLFPEHQTWLAVGLGGSFAAALSDTAGSEIGQLYGRRPISPITFRPVPAGTEGAVSLEGTLGAFAAAGIMGLGAAVFGLTDARGALAVALGGAVGSSLESIVGSFAWSRSLGHMLLNFSNTVVGALAAAAALALLGG